MRTLDRAAAHIQGRRPPAIDTQRGTSGSCANNIYDSVNSTHFMKMHRLNGNLVNRRLHLAEQLECATGALFHSIGQRR